MEKSSTAVIHGRSMEPFLFQGDIVELAPIRNDLLEEGHVYVFKDSLYSPIAHRLRVVQEENYIFQGDRQNHTESVLYTNIYSETRRVLARKFEPKVEKIVLGVLKNYFELANFYPIKNTTLAWNWGKIVAFLRENKLIPLFGIAMKKAGLWSELQENEKTIFLQSFVEATARYEKILQTKNRIIEILPSSIFIKGAKLANEIYTEPFVRIMNDIDILVPEDQFEISIKKLKANGFEFSEAMNKVALFYHQVGATDIVNGMHIELHKTLFQECRYKFDSSAYMNDFTKERELVYLCSHVVCHWGRHILGMFDIYNILKTQKINFTRVVELAKEQNALLATAFVFECMDDWWNFECSINLIKEMNFLQKIKLKLASYLFKNNFDLNIMSKEKRFLQVLLFDENMQLVHFILNAGRRKMRFID